MEIVADAPENQAAVSESVAGTFRLMSSCALPVKVASVCRVRWCSGQSPLMDCW